MFAQLSKPSHDQQLLRRRGRVYFFMFQYPGIAMRNKHSVQTRCQRGIYIRPRAVPNHPGRFANHCMLFHQHVVRGGIFFRNDFGRSKIFLQAGPRDLARLLFLRSLRYQNQAVPLAKIFQSLRDLWQKLNGMIFDQKREAFDLRVQLRRNRIGAELLKRIHQRVRKTVQPVPVLHHAIPLHIVQHFSYLLGRKLVMIQKGNKARNRTLEINVVFPECVVRINE